MEEQLQSLEEESSETSTEIAASWNSAQENFLAAIADRANCYRWLHTKCNVYYDKLNFYLTVPSVLVSAISGSATIAIPGLISSTEILKWVSVCIGIMTISSGVFTTVNQYMKTLQLAEAHRFSALLYGKLHRVVSSELSLRRDQRINAFYFIKTIRTEQDRLQDTSPIIVDHIIKLFRTEFRNNNEIEKPEITGDLDHVIINRSIKGQTSVHFTPQHSPIVSAKVVPYDEQ